MKSVLAIAVLFFAVVVGAQQSTPISDISAQGSPVALAGVVEFPTVAGTQPTITMKGTNVSSKEIVALRAEFDGMDSMGFKTTVLYEHDNFFKPDGMSPGEQWNLISPGQGIRELPPPPSHHQGPPSAMAELTFAQFSDGSTWGASATVQDALAERAKAKAFLEEAGSVYSQQGAKALSEFLAKYPTHADLAGFWARQLLKVQAVSGPDGAAEHIKQRLSIAAEREKKFALTP